LIYDAIQLLADIDNIRAPTESFVSKPVDAGKGSSANLKKLPSNTGCLKELTVLTKETEAQQDSRCRSKQGNHSDTFKFFRAFSQS
jgi:hypothetical protein